MAPNKVVLHTTEGMTWPGYKDGATAPTLTSKPDIKAKRLVHRQHFPLERSARALRNPAGGVQTNTEDAIQIELVGTCDPTHAKTWNGKVAGVDYIYWPAAPDWALRGLAAELAELHRLFPAIPLTAPAASRWLAYPASYGNANRQRMSNPGWDSFKGICGHQHVPENVHGDPGSIDIAKILAYAKNPLPPTRVTKARDLIGQAVVLLREAAAKAGPGRKAAINSFLAALRTALALLPKR